MRWLWACGPIYPARMCCGLLVEFSVFYYAGLVPTLITKHQISDSLLILATPFVSVKIKENKNCSVEYKFNTSFTQIYLVTFRSGWLLFSN